MRDPCHTRMADGFSVPIPQKLNGLYWPNVDREECGHPCSWWGSEIMVTRAWVTDQ